MKNKFWAWSENNASRILRLDGVIGDYEEDCTPADFRRELNSRDGDIEVFINSPGGNVFAAAEIYGMLKEYRRGKITAKIFAFCASAASVIACACDSVEIAPLGFVLIHNPSTSIFDGEEADLRHGAEFLSELKNSIVGIYRQKTGLSAETISQFMDVETFLNAQKALELRFADKIMYSDEKATNNLTPKFYAAKPMKALKIDCKNYHRFLILGR